MHSRSVNVLPHRGATACLFNCGVAPVGLSRFDGPLLGVCVCVSSDKHGASVCFRRLSVSHLLILTASNSEQMQSNTFTALIQTHTLLKKHVDFSDVISFQNGNDFKVLSVFVLIKKSLRSLYFVCCCYGWSEFVPVSGFEE